MFRAISVIRISRLLSVTAGTTASFFLYLGVSGVVIDMLSLLKSSKTIMHSLKMARPLLASVACLLWCDYLLSSTNTTSM